MRRADFPSDAAYYRAHRAAFTLALELGCTPKDAEDEMRRRHARERDRAAQQRLDFKINTAPLPRPADNWGAPWMLRD